MTAEKPTISRLQLTLSPEELKKKCETLVAESKQFNDAIAALDDSKCNFNSVIAAMAKDSNISNALVGSLTFVKDVSTSKEIRDAASDVAEKLEAFEIEQGMRVDLFDKVKAAAKDQSCASLTGEDARLVKKTLLDFKRNGLDLDSEKQAKLTANRKRLSELSIAYGKNVAEDKTFILCTKQELDGLDDSFINELKTETQDSVEKYKVTVQYTDLFPVLKQCKNAETRKRIDIAYNSRVPQNISMLEESVKLRHENAQLMGYKNFPSYALEVKMAKSPDAVFKFLDELREKLLPIGRQELQVLKDLKKKEVESLGQQYDGSFHSWDWSYYGNMLLKEKYQVDHNKIKEYFPMDKVTQNMLKLYEKVLGLKYTKSEKYETWHEDVTAYEVHDAKTGEMFGVFYLDLFPRDGKYTHAACFPMQAGFEFEDSSRSYPLAGMVANFAKPTKTTPSLLKHDEVVTFFHELGHVMHELCSKTKYSRFHGTRVEWDLVEAPSQSLENWCWESQVLKLLSSHYQTNEPLPDDLIKKLVDSKNVNIALSTLRQLFFATFDMTLHTKVDVDLYSLWEEFRRDIALVPMAPKTHPYSAFGHIMHGYEAGYYGYLYSQVFSADIYYTRFKKANQVLEGQAGVDYRNLILGPGGSKDGMDILVSFLGREPTPDAFLESLKST